MNDNLRKLQYVELEILKQVIEICEANNITYYVIAGTLLGAVRHGGFIPWDDDIDIAMPRPDYVRFIEIADSKLMPPYQLHTTMNGKGKYGYYYARVENTQVLLRKVATENKTVVPAWIDVFPLDGVPQNEDELNKWLKECSFWRKVFIASRASFIAASDQYKKNRSPLKEFARKVFLSLKLEKLINTRWAWKRLDKVASRYNYHDSARLINISSLYGLKRELFEKCIFGKGKGYKFEDVIVNGPEDYDFVLKQMYGDYMTPPELNNRDRHHIEII